VFDGDRVNEDAPSTKAEAFSPKLQLMGWLCVPGIGCLLVEMMTQLPYMPEAWWAPAGQTPLPPGKFDLRWAFIDPGLLGWLGGWAYLAAWIWVPVAIWRSVRANRSGIALRPLERVLLLLVPAPLALVQGLLRLTPLKYGYPLI
jgi:hypothetical protein